MSNSASDDNFSSAAEMLVLNSYGGEALRPLGPVALICEQVDPALSDALNSHLRERRQKTLEEFPEFVKIPGYFRSEYRLPVSLKRYASGEGHATILDTVRGHDLFIVTDVLNYGKSYTRFQKNIPISPDECYEDLCRLISAAHGVAKRINVFMPYLYQGRRYRRESRESLDCAVMLKRLFDLGIANFITFDAHDDRIANAVPRHNFESAETSLQLLQALVREYPDVKINKDNFMVVSADEASINRGIYYASIMQVPLGIFYRRYDPRLLSKFQYTAQYLKAHAEKLFLGENVAGKDVLIVDDMIDTGRTVLECARKLKQRKANRIFVAVSFAQFSLGLEAFDKAHKSKLIDRIFATNLAYRPDELLAADWFCDVDLSSYLALLIDGVNHNASLSQFINPNKRIGRLLEAYKGESDAG